MDTGGRPTVKNTERTTNLEVAGTGEWSVDDMEATLAEVATDLGLYISHITTLGTKRYPGNRHWHLKQHPRTRGCLDVTYWPGSPVMWISMRRNEPGWVHESGCRLGRELERRLVGTGIGEPH